MHLSAIAKPGGAAQQEWSSRHCKSARVSRPICAYNGDVDSRSTRWMLTATLHAQLTLAQIKLDGLTSVVQPYRALGGGWQQ
jgi:hypothetical protein